MTETDGDKQPIHCEQLERCPYVFKGRGWDGVRCCRRAHDDDEHHTRRWP